MTNLDKNLEDIRKSELLAKRILENAARKKETILQEAAGKHQRIVQDARLYAEQNRKEALATFQSDIKAEKQRIGGEGGQELEALEKRADLKAATAKVVELFEQRVSHA
jgi:vacuolar-type H+-ATPase subunit H